MRAVRLSFGRQLLLVLLAILSIAFVFYSSAECRERPGRTVVKDDAEYDNSYSDDAPRTPRRSLSGRTSTSASNTNRSSTRSGLTSSASQPGVGAVPGQPVGVVGAQTGNEPGADNQQSWRERRQQILKERGADNPEELAKAQEMLAGHLQKVEDARRKQLEEQQGQQVPPPQEPQAQQPQVQQPNQPPFPVTVGQQSPGGMVIPPQAGLDEMTLYLDPAEIVGTKGSVFSVNVQLANGPSKPFDELAFTLKFNKNTLRVVDGDPDLTGINIDDRGREKAFSWNKLDGNSYRNICDVAGGLISYQAKTENGVPITASGIVAAVTFEVVNTIGTAIEFVFEDPSNKSDTPLTRVCSEGRDVLGTEDVPKDGVSGGRVKFYNTFAGGTDARGYAVPASMDDVDTKIRIVFRPSKEYVQPGEEFDMLVDIENPDGVSYDELMLFLGYNQRYIYPVDRDAGNYLSKGINIFDGEYHESFPFNVYKLNRVDPEQGIVLYHMSCLKDMLTGSGTAASIRFRAVRPTTQAGTRIQVGCSKGRYESGLFYFGKDVLATREESTDGFESEPVFILPAVAFIREQ